MIHIELVMISLLPDLSNLTRTFIFLQ